MKQIMYVCQADFSDASDGVIKKIKGQIEAFKEMGANVVCFAYYGSNISISECDSLDDMIFQPLKKCETKLRRILFWLELRRIISEYNIDLVYIRYSFIDPIVLGTLKRMHRCGIKIVVEVASLYQKIDIRNKALWMQAKIDKLERDKCRKYLDKVLYVGDKKTTIFGMEANPIPNGIPYGFDIVKRTGMNICNNEIRLLAVSTMGVSRGYERLIEGLKEYYKQDGSPERIVLRFVGDGEAVDGLKRLTQEYGLLAYISFSSRLSGDALDAEFNKATLGVGALGLYNIGAEVSSTLKVKEYLMRGLPFLYAGREIGIPEQFQFSLQVPNTDDSIDFCKVLNFVRSISFFSPEQIIKEMNELLYNNFSWKEILSNELSVFLE